MVKKESYMQPLIELVDESLKTSNVSKLSEFLEENSNLPGPRGNLELAQAYTETIKNCMDGEKEKLWDLCMKLTRFSPIEAPVNDPKEFVVFCGARGIGVLGTSRVYFERALAHLKQFASDARWRVREGVAMALQTLIEENSEKTLVELAKWVESGSWLVMRAVVAGVAEPALLKDQRTAKAALELHKQIFAKVSMAKERNSDFKTLRQGLGYSLSVVISAVPKEGFELMHKLADTQDADIKWIIKENLKKNRLLKNFPKEVESTTSSLK